MLVDQALKPSTRKCYASAMRHLQKFCVEYGKISIPADNDTLMLYVSHMHTKGFKGSSIRVYLAAIRNSHIQSGLENPLGGDLLNLMLRGTMALSGPPDRKLPITFPLLKKILFYAKSRFDCRMISAALCLAFFGCMRGGEFCVPDGEPFDGSFHLTLGDVKFEHGSRIFVLSLKRSKTDVHNHGVDIHVGCSGKEECAYCSMDIYTKSRLGCSTTDPLFIDPLANILRKTQFTSILRLLLSFAGVDPSKYSPHSLRAGSATSAADNLFAEYEIKALGRWKSTAYQIYLRNPKQVSTFAKRLAQE